MSLYLPEIPDGTDTLAAALLYAKAGWYTLPVNPNDKKNPGGRVGKGWPAKSSREPDQIVAWFAGTNDLLALHVGRSGALVFDVDCAADLPEPLLPVVDDIAVPYQSTRAREPGRGHYIFQMPIGRSLGNGKGGLPGPWGEVRGKNGVIIVAPSVHEKAPQGARYVWLRVGPVPVLPERLAALLVDAQTATDAATDAEVADFLARHVEASRPALLKGKLNAWRAKLDAGESRHDSVTGFLSGALKEARAGYYRADAVVQEFGVLFWERVTADKPGDPSAKKRSDQAAADEWAGLVSWAVAQANAADLDAVRQRVEGHVPERPAADPWDFGDPFGSTTPPKEDGSASNGDAPGAEEQPDAGQSSGQQQDTPDPGATWGAQQLGDIIEGLLSGSIERLQPTVGALAGGGCLFYVGKVNGVAGASGSGKSWTALTTCAQEIAAGHHVIYIDFEDDAAGIVGRLLDVGAEPKEVLERFHYVHPDESYSVFAREKLLRQVADLRPTFVVIDSTGESMALDGAKPNDDDDTARWFRSLPAPIARRGPAVVVLDHVVKADDGGDWPIGSQRKRAAISGAQYMQSTVKPFARDQAGSARLTCAKDRHGAYRAKQIVAELLVDPRDGFGVDVTLAAPAAGEQAPPQSFRPTFLMERVSVYLEGATDARARSRIGDEVTGKRKGVLAALDVLKAEGYVTTAAGRGGAEMCTLATSYRQKADPQSDKYESEGERARPADPFADTPDPVPSRSFSKKKERGTGQDGPSEPFPGTGGERVGNGSGQEGVEHSEPTWTSLEEGPCAACLKPTQKYGPGGHKLCHACRTVAGQEAGA
jgi:hypothetical protein